MRFKVYFFDFDGTLVHSNFLKREAFYHVSSEVKQHKAIVDKVLSLIPEKSRFEIIEMIYANIEAETKVKFNKTAILDAINRYTSTVQQGVLACPELEGASQLLSDLKRSSSLIYISSNTPEDSLLELVSARGWLQYVEKCFGFPSKKNETIKKILDEKQIPALEAIVIGDGLSDEISAETNGCRFYKVTHPLSLMEFRELNHNGLYV